MKIVERFNRLLRSDVHGMLEQLEERSLLLKQHLREAEMELARKRAEAEALEEEERRLGEELARSEEAVRTLDADVELALAQGEDDLARFAVRRLLPHRKAAEELARRAGEVKEARQRLGERLEEQSRDFGELRERVRVRLAAAREERERTTPELSEVGVANEEVDFEILRRRSAGGAREEIA
ncbi:MAG: PspA/IM30 family protein [Deltaproteobacteria bacterium]|nr:PspA/IM30 family protein [Deltaproteobacteria bacterium]MBW2418197.1 PspA/IM30 family protein [Deltaproteobacteria bacterium]